MNRIFLLLVSIFWMNWVNVNAQLVDTAYNWRQLPLYGGDQVTGLYAHPSNNNIMYARTPNSGMFEYNKSTKSWKNITQKSIQYDDDLGWGIEGFAIDKTNPNNMYVAGGRYFYSTNDSGAIYKTTNAGDTWVKTNFNQAMFSDYYNNNACGDRLVVDPNNSNVLYFATRSNGVWKSIDAANNWTRLTGLPTIADSTYGATFVAIDPSSGSIAGSSKIYIGAWGQGIYQSNNGGLSFSLIKNDVLKPVKGVCTAAGKLFLVDKESIYTFASGVWNYNSPTFGNDFTAIDIDKTNPNIVYVSDFSDNGDINPIYVSYNAGVSWTSICSNAIVHNDVEWWPNSFFGVGNRSILIDPIDPKKIWLGGQYGVFQCPNTSLTSTMWYGANNGLVTSIAFKAMPVENKIFLQAYDYGGLKSDNIYMQPTALATNNVNEVTDYAYCLNTPNFIVAMGWKNGSWPRQSTAQYSEDGGETWNDFSTFPTIYSMGGSVAVSNMDPNKIVINFYADRSYYTNNKGLTWQLCNDLPPVISYSYWSSRRGRHLIADESNANRFYYFDPINQSLWRSENSGENWLVVKDSISDYSTTQIYTSKLLPNYVLMGMDWQGYFISNDAGVSWQEGDFARSRHFSIGKNKSGSPYPAMYQLGFKSWSNPTLKYYRSNDLGVSWQELIAPYEYKNRNSSNLMADPYKYGRFYLTTEGRGIQYAEIAGTEDPLPSSIDNLVSSSKMNIYPNPASTQFIVSLTTSKNQVYNMNIIDAAGKTVQTLDNIDTQSGANQLIININQLSNGMYHMRLYSENEIHYSKIVINK